MFVGERTGAAIGTRRKHSLGTGQNVIVTMNAKRSQLPAPEAMMQHGARLVEIKETLYRMLHVPVPE